MGRRRKTLEARGLARRPQWMFRLVTRPELVVAWQVRRGRA